jgi:hypothetical protein
MKPRQTGVKTLSFGDPLNLYPEEGNTSGLRNDSFKSTLTAADLRTIFLCLCLLSKTDNLDKIKQANVAIANYR